ncbi:MAG TPA: protein phosphatase 2C domain-containing protein [Sphingomonas sp.]|nr:protein phosphatase 2C domain-containing protein [Sphingomonas sp.]
MKLSAMKDWFGRPAHPPVAPPAVRSVARAHLGLVRSVNEDRLLERPDRGLWAVADGMGGHEGGDIAATTAVRALERTANRPGRIGIGDVEQALNTANLHIFEHFGRKGSSGSTVAGLMIGDDVATVFWIGDSRVYRYRGDRLELLTHDHSLVQDLVDAKVLTPDQARRHPNAHVITRALGAGETMRLDVKSLPLMAGDRFLLCTDGLWGMISDTAIAALIPGDEAEAAAHLTSAALDAGGRDNLALILVDVGERDAREAYRVRPSPSSR